MCSPLTLKIFYVTRWMQPCILHAVFYSQFPSGLKIMLNTTLRYLELSTFIADTYAREYLVRGYASRRPHKRTNTHTHKTHMRKRITLSQIDVHHHYHTDEFNLNCHVMEIELKYSLQKKSHEQTCARKQNFRKERTTITNS